MTIFNLLRTLVLALALAPAVMACKKNDPGPAATEVDAATEQAAIQTMLNAYAAALNAADAAKIATFFTQDGLFIAPGAPTATGPAQIRSTLDGLFGAVTLTLKFTPANTTVVNGNYAFATSTSSGTKLIKANGQTVPASYRELWVFAKVDGQWKIARYLFNQPS